jgi:glycerate 2-kinase
LFHHPPRSLPPGAHQDTVRQILRDTLSAVRPDLAILRAVSVQNRELIVDRRRYPLDDFERVRVLGVGKAAASMVRPLWELLADRLDGCLVIGKRGEPGDLFGDDRVEFLAGAHPIPDQDSVLASQRALDLVSALGPDDLLVVAVSGGTSSLLTLPAHGLALQAVSETTAILLRSGATIDELNAVRKHLSQTKGGHLARLASPATVVGLILSDVVGSSLSTIGSGPTAPDPSTFADARRVLEKYSVASLVPAQILAHLEAGIRGEHAETLQPDDPRLSRVQNVVIASNESATSAAVAAAQRLGFHAELRDGALTGEARTVGRGIAESVRESLDELAGRTRPTCWVYGGETTVEVCGTGRGGRNQELALSAALALNGVPGVTLVSFATDGIDGPTDAAGAIVTGSTVPFAAGSGLDATSFLDHNDSHAFFDAVCDLVRTGPTGTNVADLVLVFFWVREMPESHQ